tara:strand:+ start:1784 stop:3355 length:1572 start_codon:yes stop_codon:yes gene_type:complete
MRIGKKLFISFTIIVSFLLISTLITTVYTLKINNQMLKITGEINPLESDVQDMISILWKSNYIIQRYSTENDQEILEGLEFEFEHINNLFNKKAQAISSSTDVGSITGKISHAENKQEVFFKLSKKLIEKRNEDIAKKVVYDESSILVQYSIAKQLERDVVDGVESLQEALTEFSSIKQQANKESTEAVRNAIIMILLTTILSITAIFMIWSSLGRSIIKPIKDLSEAASKISKGNLNTEVEVEDNDDEISDLAHTFNQMILSIRKIVEESPRLKKFINLKGKKDNLTQKYVVEDGISYLIKDSSSEEAYDILIEKINKEYTPLLLTRQNPKIAEQKYGILKKNLVWLSEEKETGTTSSSNLNDIQKKVLDFIDKNHKSIILLDRSDYITNKYGFDNFLRFLININDKVMAKEAIFLLPVDPEIFNNKQLSLLEKELHKPPQQSVEASISEELREILKFIADKKAINNSATYKEVGSKFSITAPTTQKKIEELLELGLISISKIGRNKVISPTRDGTRVLANK